MDEAGCHTHESCARSFVIWPSMNGERCLVSSSTGSLGYLPRESFRKSVATRMTRESASAARAGAHTIATASSSPFLVPRFDSADLMVSLRQIKAMAQGLEPTHPLRILVLGEPDEIPRQEYASKILGWYRLILTRADSGPPGDR